MVKKKKASENSGFKMRAKLIHNADFANLLKENQIGPNGRSKEWLDVAQSSELLETLEKKGSSEYFKQLKAKFASKGFYREFIE